MLANPVRRLQQYDILPLIPSRFAGSWRDALPPRHVAVRSAAGFPPQGPPNAAVGGRIERVNKTPGRRQVPRHGLMGGVRPRQEVLAGVIVEAQQAG